MNIREQMENALRKAIEEAGPTLPKVFSISVPDADFATIARVGSTKFTLGTHTVSIRPASAGYLLAEMPLPEYAAMIERDQRSIEIKAKLTARRNSK